MLVHAWDQIVKEIELESDPAKVSQLAKQLNAAMVTEEKQKVKLRLGISPDKFASNPSGCDGQGPPSDS